MRDLARGQQQALGPLYSRYASLVFHLSAQSLDRAVAEVHGATGILARWNVRDSVAAQAAPPIIEQFASPGSAGRRPEWQPMYATGTEARVLLPSQAVKGALLFAYTDVAVFEPASVGERLIPIRFLALGNHHRCG